MVITADFEYAKPGSLDEALARLADGGGEACALAGGTDCVPWMCDEALTPSLVVDLKGIAGLDEINRRDGEVELGALVTLSDVLASPTVHEDVPVLVEAASMFASTGIRNRATVVGNLCAAVPSCDTGPVALVYDAVLLVAGPGAVREVPVDDWFVGPKATARKPGELVTAVRLAPPAGGHAGAFVKLARYGGEDLAQASVAVVRTVDHRTRVAFGAVGPTPTRARRIEELLDGKALSDELIAQARALVADETSPITDIRATAEYRAHMCQVMLDRGLRAAESRLAGDGPPLPTSLV